MSAIKYRFSPNIPEKKIKRIKLIDKLLYLFFKGPKNIFNRSVKEITIVQLAHIGDLILTLPAVKKLKELTGYQIRLVVSSQNYLITKRLKYIDAVSIADAPYFSRNKKVTYPAFINQLLKIKTDLLFDVRGDLRNIFFLKFFTGKKVFAGFNAGGGEALLNVEVPFPHGQHYTNILDPLFNYLQLPDIHFSKFWEEEDIPYDEIDDHVFPDRFMVVHLGVGAPARKWPVENFIATVIEISKDVPVYILGTEHDISPQQLETLKALPNVVSCIGKYSILQSIYIIKKCSAFLGLESGFSHIAAMLYKKVFVLFSGTTNEDVWKPYSFYENQVVLVKRAVYCDLVTGCGKLVCAENICMTNIYPFEVIGLLKEYINGLKDYNDIIPAGSGRLPDKQEIHP